MKERPILFSAPMVRARPGELKTQTRRVCKNKVYGNGFKFDGLDFLCHNDYLPPSALLMDYRAGGYDCTTSALEGWGEACPYGQTGDQLWVRESFFAYGRWITQFSAKKGRDEWRFIDMTTECDRAYQYAADNPDVPLARGRGPLPGWHLRPSIHMPRIASRITLEIVSVRVERLQDISESDAIAEGLVRDDEIPFNGPWFVSHKDSQGYADPTDAYCALWESLNGAGSWAANPWVWVVEFRRIRP